MFPGQVDPFSAGKSASQGEILMICHIIELKAYVAYSQGCHFLVSVADSLIYFFLQLNVDTWLKQVACVCDKKTIQERCIFQLNQCGCDIRTSSSCFEWW